MTRWNYQQPRPLERFILPSGRSAETAHVFRALESELPDSRYPAHDEEKFQEGFPHKGDGGYGSPGKF
jgi:hypothetical protein